MLVSDFLLKYVPIDEMVRIKDSSLQTIATGKCYDLLKDLRLCEEVLDKLQIENAYHSKKYLNIKSINIC